jgi:hypothetical protein
MGLGPDDDNWTVLMRVRDLVLKGGKFLLSRAQKAPKVVHINHVSGSALISVLFTCKVEGCERREEKNLTYDVD